MARRQKLITFTPANFNICTTLFLRATQNFLISTTYIYIQQELFFVNMYSFSVQN